MKKILILIFLFQTSVFSQDLEKAYFAGGCFWCVEESFEKLNGVEEVISGYSGGTTKDPTYKEVTYGNTGHFEVVEIIYDKKVISYKELLKNFWMESSLLRKNQILPSTVRALAQCSVFISVKDQLETLKKLNLLIQIALVNCIE